MTQPLPPPRSPIRNLTHPSTSFSTFLRAQLFPLLALSLYVSSTNYPLTRAAYSPILQWPTQYLIPPSLRSAAKAQTSHLGLSSLDLDAATSDNDNSNKAPGEDQIPKSLRIAKKSVTTALKQSEHAARFKLDALMEAAFDPLQQLLGTKRSFLSTDDEEKVSSLDCLALGYLSLALIPALPQSWLSDTMKAKHPPLCQWVWESLQAIGGADVRLEDAFVAAPSRDTEAEGKALPWQVPNPRPLTSAAAVLLTHTLASLPGLSGPTILPPPPSPSPTHNPNPKSSHDPNFPSTSTSTPTLPLLSPLLSLGAVAMALGASLAYAGLFAASPSSDAKRNLSDMGEAGAMLAMASFREDVREVQLERRLDRAAKDKADLVEVDVAVADRRGREVLPIS